MNPVAISSTNTSVGTTASTTSSDFTPQDFAQGAAYLARCYVPIDQASI